MRIYLQSGALTVPAADVDADADGAAGGGGASADVDSGHASATATAAAASAVGGTAIRCTELAGQERSNVGQVELGIKQLIFCIIPNSTGRPWALGVRMMKDLVWSNMWAQPTIISWAQ